MAVIFCLASNYTKPEFAPRISSYDDIMGKTIFRRNGQPKFPRWIPIILIYFTIRALVMYSA